MVKEIVELHRGDVRLSSDVGRGSTFQVRLPLYGSVSGSVV
jgi:signal transduction histidine kinase